GSTDIFARLAAQKLTEHFGKQFYVENIAGATGNVGTAQAARAAPDGYTLLIAFSSYVVNPTLFAKLAFDPDKDFAPVTLAVVSLNVIIVNPSLPARDLKELVALIKANPGKYSYATGGVGTQSHLLGEMLRLSLGLDIVHVPFNGAAPEEIASILALPDVKERLPSLGFEAVASTPEDFGRRIKVETETWGKVVRAANIKAE